MRTSKEQIGFVRWIQGACCALFISGSAWAVDFSTITVDPSDLQQFEVAYENWVTQIAQSIAPKSQPTVLIELDYSNKPERLQTYSELRAAQHLPGLPQVLDPHLGHPSESPLAALVESKRIKLIFEQPISSGQEQLLAEVLAAKLKIDPARGDKITVTKIPTKPAESNNNSNEPWIAAVVLLTAFALLLKFKPVTTKIASETTTESKTDTIPAKLTPPPPPVKPFRFSDEDKNVLARMENVENQIRSKAQLLVNPTTQIMKSNPKALIRVIRAEDPKRLAQALQGTSVLFQKTVLSICTSRQRSEIKEAAKALPKNKSEARFAQNLICAKIFREQYAIESELSGQASVATLSQAVEQFAENRQMKTIEQNRWKQRLQASAQSQEREFQHETI